jgi:hypothetical protein
MWPVMLNMLRLEPGHFGFAMGVLKREEIAWWWRFAHTAQSVVSLVYCRPLALSSRSRPTPCIPAA